MIVLRLNLISFLLTASLLLPTTDLQAKQDKPTQVLNPEDLIQQLNSALESRDAMILELMQRVKELEDRIGGQVIVEKSSDSDDEDIFENSRISANEELEEADKLAQSALERTLIESGSLLLPSGTIEIQPAFGYSLTSNNNLNLDCLMIADILCIGDITSEHIRDESFFTNWTFRLGLPTKMQFDVNVPISYDSRTTGSSNGTSENAHTSGIGDIDLSLSKQLLHASDWKPDIVGAFRWKTTTGTDPFEKEKGELARGTGFDDLQLSFSGVKVSDPVVIFGNVNYTYRLSDTKAEIGDVQLGDIYGLQLGAAIALNLETSLSFSWTQSWVEETQVNGSEIAGTFERPGSLRIGATYVPSAGRSIDFGVAVGITDDAPDVEVSLAFPIRLPYRIPFLN